MVHSYYHIIFLILKKENRYTHIFIIYVCGDIYIHKLCRLYKITVLFTYVLIKLTRFFWLLNNKICNETWSVKKITTALIHGYLLTI